MNRLIIFSFFILFFLLNSCFPFKAIFLAAPDKKDINRFPHAEIEASNDCFEFYQVDSSNIQTIKINDWTSDLPVFSNLDEVFENHAVRSMLVIQNDTIKYEYYRNDMYENTLHSSYSVAKSFTSTLIGIAIDESKIESENDLVVKYIPELSQHKASEYLTIKHLLNHTSGIKNSLALDAKIYYGKNILKALKSIQFESLPGGKQSYLNINTQLLGIILERATGKNVASYLEEKVWKPLGMCEDAKWSIDKRNEIEKTYCCLGATSLDYAKFGLLLLNNGKVKEKQIVSEAWLSKSLARDTTDGSSFNYNFSWHIGLKAYNDFMAIGLYKQHIYVNRNKNLIIVLFNDKEKKLKAERINWWNVLRQIADQL